jgi:tetratricopeptide (TPR) repeat protein
VRRNRALVVGSSLSVVAMLAATVISMRQSRIARDEAARATRITQYLQAVVGAADPAHYSAVRTGGSDVGLMEVLDSTRSRAGRDLADAPRVRADLYWSMANSYRAFGRSEMALQLFDSARTLHAATVGDPSLEVARDLHFAGLVHQLSGRSDEAVKLYREALSRYDRLRAVPDSERTDIETSLGQLLSIGQRKFVDGDSLMRKALHRELSAKNPRPDLIRLLHGAMASSLTHQGRWIAADSMFVLADASYARDPARLRGDRAVLRANWARLKNRTGRYGEAHALVTEGLRDYTAMAGTGSMYEVIFRTTTGESLLGLGRASDAKAMLDTALRYLAALPSPGAFYSNEVHRMRGEVAINLGDLNGAAAQLKTAESLIPQVSPTVRTMSLVQTLISWGAYETAQGDTSAAERRFRSALDSARARDGNGSLMALRAMSELARFERARGGVRVADSLLADSARLAPR